MHKQLRSYARSDYYRTLKVSNISPMMPRCGFGSASSATNTDIKYYEYGHIARYYRKTARCGHCAIAAHEQEGENACPNGQASGIKSCINCRNSHTAWNRACPAYKAASEKAKEAYAHRSRQFAIANTTASITETNQGRIFPPFTTQLESSEKYTTISRKKKRLLRRKNTITRSQFRAASS
jgi:hypothetical protein